MSEPNPASAGPPTDPTNPTNPADQTPPADLGAAARAFAEAAGTLTKALASSFQETQPHLSESLATGLREAADGINHASASVKASASAFAAERRAAKTAKTRAELLDAATRVIAARGYDACSVEDIAHAAGYTKGALYSQFASKEDLFAALAAAHLTATFTEPAADGAVPAPATPPSLDTPAICLTLDIVAYALRHPDFGARIAPALNTAVAHLAALLPTDEGAATDQNRPAAIGLIALATLVPAVTQATADDGGPAAAAQTVRLLAAKLTAR